MQINTTRDQYLKAAPMTKIIPPSPPPLDSYPIWCPGVNLDKHCGSRSSTRAILCGKDRFFQCAKHLQRFRLAVKHVKLSPRDHIRIKPSRKQSAHSPDTWPIFESIPIDNDCPPRPDSYPIWCHRANLDKQCGSRSLPKVILCGSDFLFECAKDLQRLRRASKHVQPAI